MIFTYIFFFFLVKLIFENCGPCDSQSFTLKKYPAELSLTAWICLMGMVEGAIVTLVMERDLTVWAIGWDSRLIAAVYSVSTN